MCVWNNLCHGLPYLNGVVWWARIFIIWTCRTSYVQHTMNIVTVNLKCQWFLKTEGLLQCTTSRFFFSDGWSSAKVKCKGMLWYKAYTIMMMILVECMSMGIKYINVHMHKLCITHLSCQSLYIFLPSHPPLTLPDWKDGYNNHTIVYMCHTIVHAICGINLNSWHT